MKYVDLTGDRYLNRYPLAKRINTTMHDDLNNSCVNYLDISTLKNRVGRPKPKELSKALKVLVRYHDIKITRFKGRLFISL